jgi:cytochrome o ubiquinol oxidase operon protein cyoD
MTDIEHSTVKAYLSGFLLSLVLTLASFLIVMEKLLTGPSLFISLTILGFVQAWVQLILFLHLGKESKSRANLLILLFMLITLATLFFGTIWIMFSLNERMGM